MKAIQKACIFPLVCVLLAVSSCTQENTAIPIGVILPLTGDYANLGASAKRGIELAFEHTRDSTAEDESPYVLRFEDSQGSTNGAIQSLRKLIDVDGCRIIIGELSSTATLAMAPIVANNHILMISPTASSPKLSGINPYFFRVCASDVFEGRYMAQYARDTIKAQTVAVLFINNDYGLGLAKAFSETFESLGGIIAINEAYAEKTTDFRSQLTKIRAAGAAIVYIPGYAFELANILKQSKELDQNLTFLSSIDFENPQIPQIAGKAADGVVYTAYPFNADGNRPETQAFVSRYQSVYGDDPDIYAALSYDAGSVLRHCLMSHGAAPDSIRTCLLAIQQYPGATNDIEFNNDGDARHSIIFKKYSNGKFIPLSNHE